MKLNWVAFILFFSLQSFGKTPMDGAKLSAPLPANIWIEMSKITQPGVVGIYLDVDQNASPMGRDPLFDFVEEFFGGGFQYEVPSQKEKSTPIGTGFIIDGEGHIVTNYHVIEAIDNNRNNLNLQVQIYGEAELQKVTVLGRDPRGDIALLKVNKKPKKITPLQFGNSDNLQVGEYVAAFGNPYGHSNSMTVGIVSAKGRAIKELNRFPFIQTDASINPGNSGGPLLDTKGFVIGVNTAIDARAQGIGFAIPANYVKKIIGILKSGGSIQRGFLGIDLATLHPQAALSYGINKRGVVITGVLQGYPADKAGLQESDIIFQYNKQSVFQTEDLVNLVQDTEVGKTVPVKVLRSNGQTFDELEFNVTVSSFPGQSNRPQLHQRDQRMTKNSRYQGQEAPYDFGFSVVDSSSGARRALDVPIRFPFGPIISSVKPGSPSARGGFKAGYVILKVNGHGVNTATDVFKLLKKGVNRIWIHTAKGEKRISLKTE